MLDGSEGDSLASESLVALNRQSYIVMRVGVKAEKGSSSGAGTVKRSSMRICAYRASGDVLQGIHPFRIRNYWCPIRNHGFRLSDPK